MIDNQYIHELDIDLDFSYIIELVKKNQYKIIDGMASHHRKVSDDEYMTYVREKYPCLSQTYNIYTMQPGIGLPMHIDARRSCAFNIPISGTDDSYTIFYEPVKDLTFDFDPVKIYNVITSEVVETFRYTLTRPVLINNSGPHRVDVKGSNDRVILSWSASPEFNFEQTKVFFKNS